MPTWFDMQMEMKNILASCWFVCLYYTNAITFQPVFYCFSNFNSFYHHGTR